MRFPEPRTAVYEQGIIFVRFAGVIGNRFRGGVNKFVGRTYHERFKCEFGIDGRALTFDFFAQFVARDFKVFFARFGVVYDEIGNFGIALFKRVSDFVREFFARYGVAENFALSAKHYLASYYIYGQKRRNKRRVRYRTHRFFKFGKGGFP